MTGSSVVKPPGEGLAARASAGKHVSHSQLSHKCGLALKFARERTPWPNRSVALIYGTALHAGLERWWWDRDPEGAYKAAHLTLMAELGQLPEVKWDERQRRGGRTNAITDAEVAETMLQQHVKAWHALHVADPFHVIETEKTIWIELSRPSEWKIQCRLDAILENAAGERLIVDYKTAGKPWDTAKAKAHEPQGHLYLAAETRRSGRAPDRFEFHVFVKGTEQIQVFPLAFDGAAINRYIEYKVRPTIAMIEAGAFVGETDWWGHSPRWCAYWNHCPLGAAAEPGRTA